MPAGPLSAIKERPSIVLSSDQARALQEIKSWIGSGKLRITVGGYAGTGKTTLVEKILELVQGRASVCAFTGKAAHVLITKGISSASTIHRLIYAPYDFCTVCESEDTLCKCQSPNIVTKFRRESVLPWPLVIVDESSMVSRALLEDLESFGVQTLYIGDHGQLQPIGDDPGIMRDPEVRLERIHRQAEGSPIIAFAHHVRNGNPPKRFGDDASVEIGVPRNIEKFDAVLCGYNKTRIAVNNKIRLLRGYSGELPQPGERIICLRNKRDAGVFNGMLATVIKIHGSSIDIENELGERIHGLPFAAKQFGSENTLSDTPRDFTLWDYGYCLTVHKSQGSSWKNVAVLEQIARSWPAARWRYTAATRASHRLVYCIPRGR